MSTATKNPLNHVILQSFENNPNFIPKIGRISSIFSFCKNQTPIKLTNCLSNSIQSTHKIVHEFDPNIPVEEAVTPPSSWYFDPAYYSLEIDRVFYNGWRVVGCIDQIKNPHDYFTGRLGNVEYVICQDSDGEIHAFHNVCRHHASVLAYGSGRKTCFVCPYHGWTYGLEGNLLKAQRITGLQNFDTKVFCDNYLDGGYHVPYAHKNLASGLNLDTYSSEIFEKVSIQRCASGGEFDRLGSEALYAYIYPNFIINRYGPWMDTNLVVPLGPRKCQVVFDYFLDASLKDDNVFIEKSLKDSEEVQIEDIMLCEGVQRGLESPAYNTGRYAPTLEKLMHHFHCLLYSNLTGQTLQY
ncbi:choline monooxygenase, chloroplastic-like isoform X2 [Chenopodium quinoa]|uniref:choline monooxygenase, chloroplastic-like isoform X2 n=1 Tax=Chenopodium quinoa TaxID=63459 RepID=UPI000B799CD7|nr:choline monooxygenase, chloroplastic-like isoform X2 [Chenopodium quinoa]